MGPLDVLPARSTSKDSKEGGPAEVPSSLHGCSIDVWDHPLLLCFPNHPALLKNVESRIGSQSWEETIPVADYPNSNTNIEPPNRVVSFFDPGSCQVQRGIGSHAINS